MEEQKYTTEDYSKLLDGRLPCSDLEIELCERLLDALNEKHFPNDLKEH